MRTIVEGRFHRNNPTPAFLLVFCALLFPPRTAAQSLLERTPNISGGWTGAPGVVHFNFLHRFTRSSAPARQVSNTPTFLLAYTPMQRALLGVNYVTRSDLVAAYPNEWEIFARYAPFDFASLQVGYNNAAQSVDAEVGAHYDLGRLRLLGAGRVLSNAFADDSLRFVVAAGGALRLNRWIALAGDVARPVTITDAEDMAWSAALQLAIPYTPHTFSLQAANTNSATLQGSSRGSGSVRYGFEFTIPVTLARWFGGGRIGIVDDLHVRHAVERPADALVDGDHTIDVPVGESAGHAPDPRRLRVGHAPGVQHHGYPGPPGDARRVEHAAVVQMHHVRPNLGDGAPDPPAVPHVPGGAEQLQRPEPAQGNALGTVEHRDAGDGEDPHTDGLELADERPWRAQRSSPDRAGRQMLDEVGEASPGSTLGRGMEDVQHTDRPRLGRASALALHRLHERYGLDRTELPLTVNSRARCGCSNRCRKYIRRTHADQ